jgi:hypothetical protein
MKLTVLSVVASAIFLLFVGTLGAQTLPAPSSRPVLEVHGHIKNTNSATGAVFDIASLEAIGLTRIRTQTKWTQGVSVFEGVLLRDLLDHVGASGTEIHAVALNDYKVTIPIADFRTYDVILAFRRDGAPMPVREKGPLWIMYPFDDVPLLRTDVFQTRSVWQLKAIEVR